ncbi:hypothetical protein TA3x_002806 [Tundrisphaera sp. TA3]|uniref:hypothetical protein n=1 Tax=Tundrisphaera sp. TA3 TaxID=3435775 RepID=UPI003EB801F7
MAELFRFRCFRCQKLMGAPESKFGKTIRCPRCGVELVVPSPEDVPADDADENAFAVNLEDIGVKLDPLPPRKSPPSSSSLLDPNFSIPESNPIAFLEAAPPPPEPAPEAEGPDAEGGSDAEVAIDVAPAVSPITGRRPVSTAYDPAGRRRDVMLPRTVVMAWALGALGGLGFAFLSGLLIGHFLW